MLMGSSLSIRSSTSATRESCSKATKLLQYVLIMGFYNASTYYTLSLPPSYPFQDFEVLDATKTANVEPSNTMTVITDLTTRINYAFTVSFENNYHYVPQQLLLCGCNFLIRFERRPARVMVQTPPKLLLKLKDQVYYTQHSISIVHKTP